MVVGRSFVGPVPSSPSLSSFEEEEKRSRMNNPAPLDTRFPMFFTHQSPTGGETPSTMCASSTTSSMDVGRMLAFAVAERVLDDLEVDEQVLGWNGRLREFYLLFLICVC